MAKIFNFRVMVILFAVTVFTVAISFSYVAAKPPGVDDVGKMLKKFNVIVLPENSNWGDSNASCNGARIFFQEGGPALGKIGWDFNVGQQQNFVIDDCNGTDGEAEIDVNEAWEIAVFLRVHGRAGSYLDLTCKNVFEDGSGNDLCLIDNVKIRYNKSNSFTKIMKNIADGEYERVLWEFDGDWKIFEVRLYELND